MRIRVCTSAADAESVLKPSAGMRKQLDSLQAQVTSAGLPKAGGGSAALTPSVLRHLLVACSKAAAVAACDEFRAVTKSGSPKQPELLLLSALLKVCPESSTHCHSPSSTLPRRPGRRERPTAAIPSLEWETQAS